MVDEASMKRMVYGVEEGHRDLARLVLRRAAGRALERSSNSMDVMIGEDGQIDGGGSTNAFNGVVEQYYKVHRKVLIQATGIE